MSCQSCLLFSNAHRPTVFAWMSRAGEASLRSYGSSTLPAIAVGIAVLFVLPSHIYLALPQRGRGREIDAFSQRKTASVSLTLQGLV